MNDYKRLTERNSVGLVDTLCKHCMFNGDCTGYRTHCDRAVKERLCELEDKIEQGVLVYQNKSNDSFDCGYHEYAKEKHNERVLKNPQRIDFAIKQFEANNINYVLKNESTGHFHCWRKSDDKLFQFYAGTGKIVGEEKRGVYALIQILRGGVKNV